MGRRLARPQRQAGALTADVLAVIRLTAPKPRARGRGMETPQQAAERAKFDLALVAVLSDGGLRRSEAAALGRRQRPHHRGPLQDRHRSPWRRGGRHPRRHGGLWTPSGRWVFMVARRCSDCRSPRSPGGVKAIARATGLSDWELFSGHSGRVSMARRMAQNGASTTHEIERQGRWKQGGGMVGRYTRGESAGSDFRYL